MKKVQKWMGVLAAVSILTGYAVYAALADHDGHKEKVWHQENFYENDDDDEHKGKKKRYQKRNRNQSDHYEKEYLMPVNNPTYAEQCGACHFAYQPKLLPSGSWVKILAGLDDHFGEVIELDPDSKKTITEYLKSNGAEYSREKRAVKIMRSLGDQTPLRITEIPYIIKKHHEVSKSVFERESIGSLSNCSACHTTAERGIYDDDSVVIPK